MRWRDIFDDEKFNESIRESIRQTEADPEFQKKMEEYHRTHPSPKCPICGSENIREISATEKIGNTLVFGIFGNKRKKQFKCMNDNCGYMF